MFTDAADQSRTESWCDWEKRATNRAHHWLNPFIIVSIQTLVYLVD